MSLPTASMGIEDDWARTKDIKLDEFPARGGKFTL